MYHASFPPAERSTCLFWPVAFLLAIWIINRTPSFDKAHKEWAMSCVLFAKSSNPSLDRLGDFGSKAYWILDIKSLIFCLGELLRHPIACPSILELRRHTIMSRECHGQLTILQHHIITWTCNFGFVLRSVLLSYKESQTVPRCPPFIFLLGWNTSLYLWCILSFILLSAYTRNALVPLLFNVPSRGGNAPSFRWDTFLARLTNSNVFVIGSTAAMKLPFFQSVNWVASLGIICKNAHNHPLLLVSHVPYLLRSICSKDYRWWCQ